MRRLGLRMRCQRGQTIAVVAVLALGFPALLAFVLDAGSWYHDQRKARNVADASALAGAQDLPNQGAASSSASSYATQNGGSLTSVPTFPDAVTIRVIAQVPLHTVVSQSLGVPGIPANVTQTATASLVAASTVSCPPGAQVCARPLVFSASNPRLTCGLPCYGSSNPTTFTVQGGAGSAFGATDAANIYLTPANQSGQVHCDLQTYASWIQNGYPGDLTIPKDYPACDDQGFLPSSPTGPALQSLVGKSMYVLIATGASNGGIHAIGWAQFHVTKVELNKPGQGEVRITGYFEAAYVGGPPNTGCSTPTGCYYGVGTVALTR